MQQRTRTWFRSLAAESWGCNLAPLSLACLSQTRAKPSSRLFPAYRSACSSFTVSLLTHRRPVENCGAVDVLTRSITHHKAVITNAARSAHWSLQS